MNLSEYIVPQNVRSQLVEFAKTESDALWGVARLCLGVFLDFKEKQKIDPRLGGVDDYRVWRACGGYARKSADRIKTLATVAAEYPPEKVRGFTERYGEWAFGYYERTWRYEDIEQEAIFEFLAAVKAGEFEKIPARRLGVGEFISSYEYNVRHLQVARVPAPALFYGGLPVGDVLAAVQRLREGLREYMSRPRVRKFVELVNELEASMPGVLEEIGFTVDSQVEDGVK